MVHHSERLPQRRNPNHDWPVARVSGELLYTDLLLFISQHAEGHPEAPHRRDIGITGQWELPQYGPVDISDAPTAQSHRRFRPESAAKPDLEAVMEAGNPILSVVFRGQLPPVPENSPDSLGWYIVARPEDLRPGSQDHQRYDRAVQWHYRRPADYEVIFFNDKGIMEPSFSPLLQSLSRSFKAGDEVV